MRIIASARVPSRLRLIDADTVVNRPALLIPQQRAASTAEGFCPSQPLTIPRPRTAASAELLSRQIDALLTCPDLTDTTRLAAVNAVTRAADPTPCPHWCAECVSPDPGVIVHYSQPWEGVDQFDGATWQVQVTQRIAEGIADLAVVDVIGDGTFGSLAAFTEALSAAQRLADDINGGAR